MMDTGNNKFRATGMWPFSALPPRVAMRATLGAQPDPGPVAEIFDPVALAFNAGGKLIEAGWPGISIMPEGFRWAVIDAPNGAVDLLVREWVTGCHNELVSELTNRLESYRVDELARRAMTEAINSYQRGHCLSVVRTLMPEVERFGRIVLERDGPAPPNQKEAIEAIKKYLGSIPASHFDPIENLTLYSFLADNLFATCYTAADARQLGPLPNRHAELHGLMSYGDLRGATVMLGISDFLLHAVSLASRD